MGLHLYEKEPFIMKIGILEIMPKGHYTLVDSVARIFASDGKNEVYILTHQEGKEVLDPLLSRIGDNVRILSMKPDQSINSFLKQISSLKLDRLYIATLEKYFSEINSCNFNCQIYLFIHNIDSWFQVKLFYRLYNFFKNFSLSPKIIYVLKTSFVYPSFKNKIISKVYNSGGKFVVLNKILKTELARFVNKDLIEVIPFSVYDESLKDQSGSNSLLHICIPGLISFIRRDYISVFKLIENDIEYFKNKIELDLLGGISTAEEGEKIIEYADKLISKGIKITYYKKYLVPLFEFDQQLTQADIILGNMHIVLNKFSKYGKTKESGIIFTMIRSAKPGILPEGYSLIDELNSSSIIFKDYEDLNNIIRDLIQNPSRLEKLKEKALENSKKFKPKILLKNLSD
jgi:hypothetical protein